jgi:predicted nuclease of predicted toxin-antitoxin system
VRLKLDENLPEDARAVASELGHDADTVVEESLGGASDPDVLAAATGEHRLIVTLDRGFGDAGGTRPALTRASWSSESSRRTRRP